VNFEKLIIVVKVSINDAHLCPQLIGTVRRQWRSGHRRATAVSAQVDLVSTVPPTVQLDEEYKVCLIVILNY
jgi:hypothetical protein